MQPTNSDLLKRYLKIRKRLRMAKAALAKGKTGASARVAYWSMEMSDHILKHNKPLGY